MRIGCLPSFCALPSLLPNPSLKRSPNSRPRYSASILSLPRGLLLGPA